jgi:transcriptional regulator with XRE-family HTH domain
MFSNTLVHLRKEADMSQQQVADKLKMARATYANLETGKRSPTLEQINSIAALFGVSPSGLVEDKVYSPKQPIKEIKLAESTQDIRPRDVVKAKVETLREILLYVLDKVGAKPNVGETVLYKLLYFIDFDYYEKTGKSITGLTYIRNHHGPTPMATFGSVVKAMKDAGELEVIDTKYFNYNQKKYLPVKKPRLENVTADELQHVDEVLNRLSDKTASELSSLSHRDMPWLATKENQKIEYQLAMYRTTETTVKEPEDEF